MSNILTCIIPLCVQSIMIGRTDVEEGEELFVCVKNVQLDRIKYAPVIVGSGKTLVVDVSTISSFFNTSDTFHIFLSDIKSTCPDLDIEVVDHNGNLVKGNQLICNFIKSENIPYYELIVEPNECEDGGDTPIPPEQQYVPLYRAITINGVTKQLYNDISFTVDTGASSFAEITGSPDDNLALKNKFDTKVDKETGKGLSTNDYSNTDKGKVDNLPSDTNSALADKASLSDDNDFVGENNFQGDLFYRGEEVATKADLSTVFKYKGSVATYDDLADIVDPEVGDVYNVVENDKNYAWSGSAWDDLGGIVDLSNYYTKSETELYVSTNYYDKSQSDTLLLGKVDKDGSKVLSDNNYDDADKGKVDNLPADTNDELDKKQNIRTTSSIVSAVTLGGDITINSYSCKELVLNCDNKIFSHFKITTNQAFIGIVFQNVQEGCGGIIYLTRTNNSSVGVLFQQTVQPLVIAQIIDGGQEPLLINGTDNGDVIAIIQWNYINSIFVISLLEK